MPQAYRVRRCVLPVNRSYSDVGQLTQSVNIVLLLELIGSQLEEFFELLIEIGQVVKARLVAGARYTYIFFQ
jgi:hypothetical protein